MPGPQRRHFREACQRSSLLLGQAPRVCACRRGVAWCRSPRAGAAGLGSPAQSAGGGPASLPPGVQPHTPPKLTNSAEQGLGLGLGAPALSSRGRAGDGPGQPAVQRGRGLQLLCGPGADVAGGLPQGWRGQPAAVRAHAGRCVHAAAECGDRRARAPAGAQAAAPRPRGAAASSVTVSGMCW